MTLEHTYTLHCRAMSSPPRPSCLKRVSREGGIGYISRYGKMDTLVYGLTDYETSPCSVVFGITVLHNK
ncbi:hypothetical protein KIPB_016372, partial [Kipferlia bialata]|eukprot:g16372.t1